MYKTAIARNQAVVGEVSYLELYLSYFQPRAPVREFAVTFYFVS